jgi:acyl carrier protein
MLGIRGDGSEPKGRNQMERSLRDAVLETVRPFTNMSDNANELGSGPLSLGDDLGIDSGRFVEIVLRLEDRFQLTIEDSAVDKLRTIEEIVTYIQCHAATR